MHPHGNRGRDVNASGTAWQLCIEHVAHGGRVAHDGGPLLVERERPDAHGDRRRRDRASQKPARLTSTTSVPSSAGPKYT